MITVILSNSGGELDRRVVQKAATAHDPEPVIDTLRQMLGDADLQPGDTVTVVETA